MKRAGPDPMMLSAASRLREVARRAQARRNQGAFAASVRVVAVEGTVLELSPAGALIVADAIEKAAEMWT